MKFYDDVELYTDKAGYRLLIEELRLPYKNVHMLSDELTAYRSELWALSKISVYAAQKQPFIHVDGDVFIWKKFSPALENAPLMAQSFEKGTEYYHEIAKELAAGLTFIPEELDLNVTAMEICSCNAGIIGGSDLSFFKKYTALAFEMVEKNDCDKLTFRKLNNFNLVFEQMLFWQLARREGVEVACMFDRVYEDYNYHFADIGDFSVLPYTKGYIHLLGSHKQNAMACDMVHRYVFAHYPQYYFAVKKAFKESRTYEGSERMPLESLPLEIEEISDVSRFDTLIDELVHKTSRVSLQDWISRESDYLDNLGYFLLPDDQPMDLVLVRDPLVSIVKLTNNLAAGVKDLIGTIHEGDVHVTLLPEVIGAPCYKLLLDTLDCLILCYLDVLSPITQLMEELKEYFPEQEIKGQYEIFREVIMQKVNRLCVYKCIKVYLPSDVKQSI